MNFPDVHTNTGESLSDLSRRSRTMIVFLRHFGCTFSREAMSDLARFLPLLTARGIRPVLVHTSPPAVAEAVFQVYDLEGIPHISDPAGTLYRDFGLGRVTPFQLLSFKNLWRYLVVGIFKGHWIGRISGDPYQLPGVFLYQDNRILSAFIYRNVCDRPDMKKLLSLPETSFSLG